MVNEHVTNKYAKAIVNGNTLKMKRWIEWDNVRDTCIKYNYYTCGDNYDYMNLMEFVSESKVLTDSRLLYIACDIFSHSDDTLFDGLNDNESIEMIARQIYDNTQYYFELIQD